MTDIKTCFYLS